MIYYIGVGIVYSLYHNYNLFYEQEPLLYKTWSFLYIAAVFPIAVLVRIMNSNWHTQKALEVIINFFLSMVEK